MKKGQFLRSPFFQVFNQKRWEKRAKVGHNLVQEIDTKSGFWMLLSSGSYHNKTILFCLQLFF